MPGEGGPYAVVGGGGPGADHARAVDVVEREGGVGLGDEQGARRAAAGEIAGNAQRGEVGDVAELTAFVAIRYLATSTASGRAQRPTAGTAVTSMTVTIFRRIAHLSVPRHGRIAACPATV